MARMKFLCDAERCIECNACVTACKNEHEVPWGVNRRRVVTIQDGKPGERSISVACMHCSDAPCTAVCPVDCFYQTDQGVVLIVQAERPETLDLMRRHLPDLMQDLKNMGFGDVSYSDQQQQQNQERAGTAIRADAAPIEDPETQMVQATGLDLRL